MTTATLIVVPKETGRAVMFVCGTGVTVIGALLTFVKRVSVTP